MTTLSPAAQAVDDAFWETINDKWNIYDRRRAQLAAALRAAADQVVPRRRKPMYADSSEESAWSAQQDTREELLSIAAELENQ